MPGTTVGPWNGGTSNFGFSNLGFPATDKYQAGDKYIKESHFNLFFDLFPIVFETPIIKLLYGNRGIYEFTNGN